MLRREGYLKKNKFITISLKRKAPVLEGKGKINYPVFYLEFYFKPRILGCFQTWA